MPFCEMKSQLHIYLQLGFRQATPVSTVCHSPHRLCEGPVYSGKGDRDALHDLPELQSPAPHEGRHWHGAGGGGHLHSPNLGSQLAWMSAPGACGHHITSPLETAVEESTGKDSTALDLKCRE